MSGRTVLTPAAFDDIFERVRSRVLERIAADAAHLTGPDDGGGWQPFLKGIEFKALGEEGPVLSYLLRLAPGAIIPAHRHPLDEECVVLRGELRIGDTLRARQGDYQMVKAGVPHAPITTETGALIFLRGAVPEASHLL